MTTAEAALLRQSAAWFDVKLDRQASGRVEGFLDLLAFWNRRVRLTGERDTPTVLRRHVADSFAPASYLPVTGLAIDIGSGAGFPGIILACLRPDLEVVLIESRRRRVSFLREVIRQVVLPRARVIAARAEDVATDPELTARADVVVSRAIRLDRFLALAEPFVAPGGTVVAMQTSRSAAAEMAGSPDLLPAGRRDYRLPDGASRTLLFFSPRPSVP